MKNRIRTTGRITTAMTAAVAVALALIGTGCMHGAQGRPRTRAQVAPYLQAISKEQAQSWTDYARASKNPPTQLRDGSTIYKKGWSAPWLPYVFVGPIMTTKYFEPSSATAEPRRAFVSHDVNWLYTLAVLHGWEGTYDVSSGDAAARTRVTLLGLGLLYVGVGSVTPHEPENKNIPREDREHWYARLPASATLDQVTYDVSSMHFFGAGLLGGGSFNGRAYILILWNLFPLWSLE